MIPYQIILFRLSAHLAVDRTDRPNHAVCLKLCRYSGYYISGHVLLNLLNEFGKSDKMGGATNILSLFRN